MPKDTPLVLVLLCGVGSGPHGTRGPLKGSGAHLTKYIPLRNAIKLPHYVEQTNSLYRISNSNEHIYYLYVSSNTYCPK